MSASQNAEKGSSLCICFITFVSSLYWSEGSRVLCEQSGVDVGVTVYD